MTSVLCTSGNKHDQDDKDYEDEDKRPISPPIERRQVNEPTSPQHMLPVDNQPASAYSRVDKLQTRLRLPDGREFCLLTCVDLALNLILNSFDSARNGTIRVLSFKVTTFLLIDATIEEKYQYLFNLVADRDNKINDSRLWLLVYEIMQLPRQLGEAQTCGNELDVDILMCFMKNLKTKGNDHRSSSIKPAPSIDSQISSQVTPDEDDLLPSVGLDRFYEWMSLEPSIVAWIPAMHRLIAGEKLVHQVRCAACQTCPIRGLRYRCLRCLNFELCQNCFLIGRVEKSHKITHPIQEYTSTLQRSDSLRDFSRVVRNRFKSKEKFRQSSLDSDTTSKSSNLVLSKPTGTQSYHNRPPKAVPIRQNSANFPNTNPSPSNRQSVRPASLGETRKRIMIPAASSANKLMDSSIPRGGNRPRRGGSMDQEHELIAQYSHSLRRQNSLTTTGARPPMYYGTKDSTHSLTTPWNYNSVNYDRSRPVEPAYYTLRPNQLRGGGSSFRASSQPPTHPASTVFVTGPPINYQPRYYRNPSGWTAPMLTGSAGSLDKVLINLEEENRFLRSEYDRLRMQSPSQNMRPLRSPSLQYPLSQPGLYQDQERLSAYQGMYGNTYLPPGSQVNIPTGYGRNQVYLPNNGILYGGSLGRGGSTATAYSAFLRSGGSNRMSYDPISNQHYGQKSYQIVPASQQQVSVTPTQEGELAQETRLLRQHKTRLESRMQLLEDHNKALEDQLNRLRQYLNIPTVGTPPPQPTSQMPAPLTASNDVQPTPYSRTNGLADRQQANGYPRNQYPPPSDRTDSNSSLANPAEPRVYYQDPTRPQVESVKNPH
ncbi:unnamed protein product [Rodentolepis nana]|uniref:ZZ-type domain-containing protein n=1 Tax=Rodentolepis nana TaxID=102285 RepID=A0A158QI48_RODNA|nr:unnamed protein product [Rodentolepis nana]